MFYFLVWILPLAQHPLWSAQVGPLSVFEYLGVMSLLCAIFRILSRGQIPPFFSTWVMRAFLLLYLMAVLSSIGQEGPGLHLSDSLIICTSSLSIFVITLTLVDTMARLRWTILAIIGSYAWASLYVIREWQLGSAVWEGYRPGWIVGDSNFFATAAIVAICLAFRFMQGERARWERIYCLGCLLTTLIGVTLCASRGGFLGLAVASPLLAWRTRHRTRNFALLIALVLPLALFLPVSPLHRFLDPTIQETGSDEAHYQAWKAGWRMIEAHPLVGVGLGQFKPVMPLYRDPDAGTESLAHNMFIEMAAEMGLLALVPFIGVFISSYRMLGRLQRSATTPTLIVDAASALRAGIVGIAVAGCFVSAEYQKTTWMSMALVACLWPLARSQNAAQVVRQQVSRLQGRKAARVEVSNNWVTHGNHVGFTFKS